MKSNASRAWVLILLIMLVIYGGYRLRRYVDRTAPRPEPTSAAVNKPTSGFPAPEFSLVDQWGEAFGSKDLAGQVYIAGFFFSDCASACVILNNQIASLLRGDLADTPVHFVSFSVDPQRDTPAVLAGYAARFATTADLSRWHFLTDPGGKSRSIQEVCEKFHLAFGVKTHTDRLVLVDAQGIVQGMYNGTEIAQVRKLVKKARELAGTSRSGPHGAASADDAPTDDPLVPPS